MKYGLSSNFPPVHKFTVTVLNPQAQQMSSSLPPTFLQQQTVTRAQGNYIKHWQGSQDQADTNPIFHVENLKQRKACNIRDIIRVSKVQLEGARVRYRLSMV